MRAMDGTRSLLDDRSRAFREARPTDRARCEQSGGQRNGSRRAAPEWHEGWGSSLEIVGNEVGERARAAALAGCGGCRSASAIGRAMSEDEARGPLCAKSKVGGRKQIEQPSQRRRTPESWARR